MLNVLARPLLAPARLCSGLESTSTTPGGLRGGRLLPAVQGATSPAGQCQGLPSSQQQDSLGGPSSSVLWLSQALSPVYVKELAFPSGPSSTLAGPGAPRGWCGDLGRALVAKEVMSPTNLGGLGQLTPRVGD